MPSDSTVTLGDVQFDPVATQDFRLSVEGTSGTGKSILGGTPVYTESGRKPIESVESGERVLSLNKRSYEQEFREVRAVIDHEAEVLVRITLEDGTTITGTEDHGFLTIADGKIVTVAGSEVGEGLWMPCSRQLPVSETVREVDLADYVDDQADRVRVTESELATSGGVYDRQLPLDFDLGYIAGAYLADGSFGHDGTTVQIATSDDGIRERLSDLGFNLYASTCNRSQKQFARFVREEFGHLAADKEIPEWAFTAPQTFREGLLSGYFDGDGSIPENGSLQSTIASEGLAHGLKEILTQFGVWATVNERGVLFDYEDGEEERTYFRLYVEKASLQALDSVLDLASSHKADEFAAAVDTRREGQTPQVDYIPNYGDLLQRAKRNRGWSERESQSRAAGREIDTLTQRQKAQRRTYNRVLDDLSLGGRASALGQSDIRWQRVVEVETVEEAATVYDLDVEQNDNFIADGVFVHNSNTLATVLEDLADVAIPTLIVERLGALSPVRLEDEDIVVVGARDEEGVDLAVALEDLDQLGAWVLDRGMKVLLDVSTYADYEAEQSRIHLAAAKALRSLNDRAHEKYRSGDRTKSLLVVDEAHILAPKDTAPEPELDEWVKRCRGQLIKASTEGGNKGISIVVGYQRRAFLHNGVIQLAQDFVAHRPGDEDIGRTADALRCSEEALASLGTGEILARGPSITDGELVGPTTVRKRRSPDPREETFELPETPDELADVLEEIQDEVEAERERRDERQDELERLRAENERLREQKEELEQELADVDRLGSALEKLSEANGGGAAKDVGEGVADLQERVDELKQERDALQDELDRQSQAVSEIAEERDAAEERVADLEADVQELRAAFDAAAADVASLAEAFEVEIDVEQPAAEGAAEAEEVTRLRERIEKLEGENDRLRAQVDAEIGDDLQDYDDFLQLDAVQAEIEAAKDEATCSPRYVKGVIAAIIAESGPVSYDAIAERLGVSTASDVSKAASELERRKIVTKDRGEDGMRVDLNVDGLAEIRQAAAEREKTEQLMEDL